MLYFAMIVVAIVGIAIALKARKSNDFGGSFGGVFVAIILPAAIFAAHYVHHMIATYQVH